MNPHRVAIYYAPAAGSAWHAFGSSWLGRDAISGEATAPPALTLPQDIALHDLTTEPRRYGFHATLKAPFRIAEPYRVADVNELLTTFASWGKPVSIGPLTPTLTDGYVALLPATSALPEIHSLAAQIVRFFESVRTGPEVTELARRRTRPLNARQEALLEQYGYPYVLDQFCFHLTLSNRVTAGQAASLIAAATPYIDRLNREPLSIDALSLFIEPKPGADFLAVHRAACGATRG